MTQSSQGLSPGKKFLKRDKNPQKNKNILPGCPLLSLAYTLSLTGSSAPPYTRRQKQCLEVLLVQVTNASALVQRFRRSFGLIEGFKVLARGHGRRH